MQDLEAVLDASEELRKSPKLKKILEVRVEVSFGVQMIFKTLCALATRSIMDPASIFQILTTLGKCAVKHFLWDTFTQGTQNLAPKKMFTYSVIFVSVTSLEGAPLLRGKENFFWSRNPGLTSISTQNVTVLKEG